MDVLGNLGSATEAVGVAGLVAASYASTNLDNFFVLSAYSAKSGYRPLFIKLTFVFVCLTVLAASLALARAADSLIADKLRFLGAIPLAIGLYQLGKLLFGKRSTEDARPEGGPGLVGWSVYLGFGLALLANSSDTVIVLAPLFADLRLAFVVLCATAALAVAIAMSSVADLIANHPLLRAKVETIAKWALPLLLIGIGLMIVLDKPADVFLAQAAEADVRVLESGLNLRGDFRFAPTPWMPAFAGMTQEALVTPAKAGVQEPRRGAARP